MFKSVRVRWGGFEFAILWWQFSLLLISSRSFLHASSLASPLARICWALHVLRLQRKTLIFLGVYRGSLRFACCSCSHLSHLCLLEGNNLLRSHLRKRLNTLRKQQQYVFLANRNLILSSSRASSILLRRRSGVFWTGKLLRDKIWRWRIINKSGGLLLRHSWEILLSLIDFTKG